MQFYFRVVAVRRCSSKIAGPENAKDPVLAGSASFLLWTLPKLELSRYFQSKLTPVKGFALY